MRAVMSGVGWLVFGGLATALGLWAMAYGDAASFAVFVVVMVFGAWVMYATESKGVPVQGWKDFPAGERADHADERRGDAA